MAGRPAPEGARINVVVATAVNSEGQQKIQIMDVGTSEDDALRLASLRSFTAHGLGGVELVTSDGHNGLGDAIPTVFGGVAWQRFRTRSMTSLLTGAQARIHRTEWGGRWNRTSQGWRGDRPGGYGSGGASSRPVGGERSRS